VLIVKSPTIKTGLATNTRQKYATKYLSSIFKTVIANCVRYAKYTFSKMEDVTIFYASNVIQIFAGFAWKYLKVKVKYLFILEKITYKLLIDKYWSIITMNSIKIYFRNYNRNEINIDCIDCIGTITLFDQVYYARSTFSIRSNNIDNFTNGDCNYRL